MRGLIHLYCGDGKGKTTAAVGLAIRAAGAGKKVLFTQFYKNGSSSEVPVLREIENIETMHCPVSYGFYKNMSETQKMQAKHDYGVLLDDVLKKAESMEVLVLDEVVSACNHGTVSENKIVAFLENKPQWLEVVLTGREPSPRLMELADYISEIKKIKHPFDKGIAARKGVEF